MSIRHFLTLYIVNNLEWYVQGHEVVRARGVRAALELRDKEPQQPPHGPGLAAHLLGNTLGGKCF